MGFMSDIGRISAAVLLAAGLAGCVEVVSADPDKVSVDTGYFGEYVPGTREWLAWLSAREHCAKFSKVPVIDELKGSVAQYKCVTEK